MTIVEAIKVVLNDNTSGMSAKAIYEEIVKRGLYSFGAALPLSVVNGEIRKRCRGLDFPSSYAVKMFEIVGYQGKKPLFALYSSDSKKAIEPIKPSQDSELLPEEKMDFAYQEHIESIKTQVFNTAINNSPAFFERLVVDLLLKMGYGYDDNSGIVTGRSHDGGIDGVISEDKLGLDLIYIQAKRYNESVSIGRKEVQAFVGAMESVNKGVFITTSKFTKEAISFVERQQKSIKLIDGQLLSELLVKHQVGINTVQTMSVLRLDADYYAE